VRNIQRLNTEMSLLCMNYRHIGDESLVSQDYRAAWKHLVTWAKDYSWVEIKSVRLPRGLNMPFSDMLVMIPGQYGYGIPLKELYVDPDLRIWCGGEWVEIPHYFDGNKKYSPNEKVRESNWRYLCLHSTKWAPGDSICTFLKQVYTYLSDPFRWD